MEKLNGLQTLLTKRANLSALVTGVNVVGLHSGESSHDSGDEASKGFDDGLLSSKVGFFFLIAVLSNDEVIVQFNAGSGVTLSLSSFLLLAQRLSKFVQHGEGTTFAVGVSFSSKSEISELDDGMALSDNSEEVLDVQEIADDGGGVKIVLITVFTAKLVGEQAHNLYFFLLDELNQLGFEVRVDDVHEFVEHLRDTLLVHVYQKPVQHIGIFSEDVRDELLLLAVKQKHNQFAEVSGKHVVQGLVLGTHKFEKAVQKQVLASLFLFFFNIDRGLNGVSLGLSCGVVNFFLGLLFNLDFIFVISLFGLLRGSISGGCLSLLLFGLGFGFGFDLGLCLSLGLGFLLRFVLFFLIVRFFNLDGLLVLFVAGILLDFSISNLLRLVLVGLLIGLGLFLFIGASVRGFLLGFLFVLCVFGLGFTVSILLLVGFFCFTLFGINSLGRLLFNFVGRFGGLEELLQDGVVLAVEDFRGKERVPDYKSIF